MKKLYKILPITVLFFSLTIPVCADEIQYGTLKKQQDDTLLLQYNSPVGTTYFTCGVNGKCSKKGEKEPQLQPKLLGTYNYPISSDGNLGVKIFPVETAVYYFLYDTSKETPKKIALLPYTEKGAVVRFTKNNNAVIFESGTKFVKYDIQTKKIQSVTMPKKLSFMTISPGGSYIAGYNYSTLSHELWRFSDNKKFVTPSSMQSYLEFSSDEKEIAFLEDIGGYKTLYTMNVSDLVKNQSSSLTPVTWKKTETEDYVFAGNTLYFMANKNGPLEWDLFSFDDGKTTVVEKNVSYGDYLKSVSIDGDFYLVFLKTIGKNTNIYLHSPDTKNSTLLNAVKESDSSSDVVRSVRKYGDRTGVLLSPKKKSKNTNLFVWMHGGPQRQVSVGYHPYLSYAVYDELLERFAESGNYVFKIDYTGSSGYGADFRKALTLKVGDIEMKDIRNAIEDLDDDLNFKKVYLIGNSYGGYMALRGLVDIPKKVDGVISINGVTDWYGLIQQIPSSPFSKVFNGSPDDHNLDEYFQASVFTGMDKLSRRDMALVVWGENDTTVPVWQSTKYVDFAEKQGVNVETLSFKDETHIIKNRKNLDTLCDKIADTFSIKNVKCEN